MSAIIPFTGSPRQLDGPSSPDAQIVEEDVTVASKLVRFLLQVLKDIAALKRRFAPNHLDFEDWPVDNSTTTKYRLPHNFGGRVRWWVIDWVPTVAGDGVVLMRDASSTDANTLVLLSSANGVVTVRVEEAG